MEDDSAYDLVVLGGGAAAFAAVTEASRRGLATALVNAGLPLGGTCVNVGCVPSKRLLAVAETAHAPADNPFDAVRYSDGEPAVDWAAALDGTDDVVEQFRRENYVDVADHYGTDVYTGYGSFVDRSGRASSGTQPETGGDPTIEIDAGEHEGTRITGEKAVIATGSSPRIRSIDGLADVAYYTSETILEESDLPESVAVIGGGYVALEWGQILHRVGVDVTILQRSDRVLSGMAGQLGREIQRAFDDEGIDVVTGTEFRRVRSSAADGDAGAVQEGIVVVETETGGERREFQAAALFVAAGVEPNSENAGLEAVNVETADDGAVRVDEHYRTSNPDVYAAGDVIGEPELETVAAKEGNHAVKNAFGGDGATIDYDTVPAVVFTSPEVASVGITERAYADRHGTCTCRTVQMDDVPRAKAVENTDGLVQVVKHHETDEIVGVHMVGARAADMIMEATLAVKFGLTVDDVIDTVHPFPTFSEGVKHACQAFRRDTSTMSCCVD
jgi:mercuric reductase